MEKKKITILVPSPISSCVCIYAKVDGKIVRKWDKEECLYHHPKPIIESFTSIVKSKVIDNRKKRLIFIKIGMRDGICKCTVGYNGCITNLSFDCVVHAPQSGKL